MNPTSEDLGKKTISDFGIQWQKFTKNEGYYASKQLFADILSPLLSTDEFKGKKVVDIGSGTGRIVGMLLESGCAEITAIEPSDAYFVLKSNFPITRENIDLLNVSAEEIPDKQFDLAVSLGVIHHIPNPDPAIKRVYTCLKPGGKFFVWVYGKWSCPLKTGPSSLPVVPYFF